MTPPPRSDGSEIIASDVPDRRQDAGDSERRKSSSECDSEEIRGSESRRVLFLDDDIHRAEIFLNRNPEAIWIQTAEECVAKLVESWDEVYLDHDLGGEQYVDVERADCGMEVVRWLCKEERSHLAATRFIIHSHNLAAAMMMVLLMREMGYNAEFLPFGFTLELDPFSPDPREPRVEKSGGTGFRRSSLFRWLGRISAIFRRS
jgi:hypothetical protein